MMPGSFRTQPEIVRLGHSATLYQVQRGYPAHGYVYFKMGSYRDELQQLMTMYVAEYWKDELSR